MTIDPTMELITGRLERHRLIMVSAGKAFECYLTQIRALADHCTTVTEFLDSEPTLSGSILIEDLETVCVSPQSSTSLLGPLRSKIDESLELGGTVLMASKFPRARYPDVPGSSLLDDARLVHLPLLEVKSAQPLSCFPSWSEELNPEEWLVELIEELGLGLLARLDQVIFESPIPPAEALNQLDANELEALYFSGLLQPKGSAYAWADIRLIPQLKEALSTVLAVSVSAAPDLPRVFELLWQIERKIRSTYRTTAISVWGRAWKDSCLTNATQKAEILSRAGSFSYRGVKKITELRDPLEWLTLGELLELRAAKSEAVGTLGIEASIWRQFALEVLPIRNQVSHMRLTRHGDFATLNTWSHLLRKSLTPTPKAGQ